MKKLLLLLTLSVVAFASCSRDIVSENPTKAFHKVSDFSPQDEYGYVMSAAELAEYALGSPIEYSQKPETRAGGNQKEIKNIIPFMSMKWMKGKVFDNETARELFNNIYVVNYKDNQGFTIVSADNRIPQTLAYSDYGSLDSTENDSTTYIPEITPGGGTSGGENQGNQVNEDSIFEAYMKSMSDYVEYLGMYISRRMPTLFDSIDAMGYYYCNPRVYYSNYYYKQTESVNWKSQWHQNLPYSEFSRRDILYGSSYTWPVGCVPLALGEIFRHHEYPDTVYFAITNRTYNLNWSNYPVRFTTFSEDSEELAALLRVLGDILYVDYSDEDGETGADPNAAPEILGYFNYISDPIQDYNENKIVNSLRNDCPVFTCGLKNTGKGHAWIINGYYKKCRALLYEYDVYKNDQYVGKWTMMSPHDEETTVSVSCDWGWDGKYNGSYPSAPLRLEMEIIPPMYRLYQI